MRAHRSLLLRLLALGGAALLLLGLGLVFLYTPLSRALVVESVGTVTRDFHEQNARLFRTTVEHMGDRMRTELEDVPYTLFGDDREALQAWLTERAAHTETNAVATTRAFTAYYRRRLDDEIDRSAGEVASRLQRWTGIGLVGLLSVLLTAHGLALYALERRVDEARRKLVDAEKMASLGRMAGGIAHEFNNMLGGILGVAEEAGRDESLEEVRESLGVIARTASRAEIVTGNLLRFARPKPPRPTETVDLPGLLKDAAALVEAEAERRRVTVRIEADGAPPLRARPAEIHQVVLNLLVNAIQAMPEGGTLEVRAREDHGTVTLVVRDEGVGIPPEDLEHVFEPFWTSRRGTDEPGTGLGLAVAYAIVTSHAGTIDIDSEPGRGTTVSVRLPREGGDA